MKEQKKPELLIPIRNISGLEACKDYADAVYFSLDKLNMRFRTKEIILENLCETVSEIHKRNLKAYLTVNSVVHDKDLINVEKILKCAKKSKIDAVIVWDPAIIRKAAELKIPFHISTQANISNTESAKFYHDIGAERLILARELSLLEIKDIKNNTDVEIETFVHGAMCVSISGRCYLSSYLYDESANCGACIQPCRKSWTLTDNENNEVVCDGKYLLSAKDMCMIKHIPELIDAGIDSFKIEGRLRDSRYINVVSKCYREAIDSAMSGTFTETKVENWLKQLKKVYNRSFSEGFYFGTPTSSGFNYENSDNMSEEIRTYIGKVIKYYRKPKACIIKIETGNIENGDNILVEGKTTYLMQNVKSLMQNENEIKTASKGMLIGMKMDNAVRDNDAVYKITKRTEDMIKKRRC
ncbi:MAG: U32 family peptidase [DPANN group archaeon]|nr:U32 family peptidase [DPANN group archaeon]